MALHEYKNQQELSSKTITEDSASPITKEKAII